jgi:hypothetical protein
VGTSCADRSFRETNNDSVFGRFRNTKNIVDHTPRLVGEGETISSAGHFLRQIKAWKGSLVFRFFPRFIVSEVPGFPQVLWLLGLPFQSAQPEKSEKSSKSLKFTARISR